MNALPAELNRLFPPVAASGPAGSGNALVRALVLELSNPAEWPEVARLWQGVQADLGLPAPAIAVNGTNAYQLWFSLAEPVDSGTGRAFLHALQTHYWPGIDPARVRAEVQPVGTVPSRQVKNGYWSAFVTPDLAAIFSGDPWLEMEPNPDGQAQLLSRLQSITAPDLSAAMQKLTPLTPLSPLTPPPPVAPAQGQVAFNDPAEFLRQVMNDASVPMPLRIEAAKALLSHHRVP